MIHKDAFILVCVALFWIDQLLLLLLAALRNAHYHMIQALVLNKNEPTNPGRAPVSLVPTFRHSGAQTFFFFFTLEFTKGDERGSEGHRVDRTGHRVHAHEVH